MKKHIIFDVDGTLLDSEEAVLLSFQETLYRKTGKKTDIRDLKYALGIPSEAALRQYGFPEEEIPEIVDFWGDLTPDYRKFIKVFPGIRQLLEKLKENGARLGIVTSRNAEEYRRDFLPFGLEGYFDTVICADDTLIHKPYGEPVKEYLRRENARAEDAVFIGDTVYDMDCAADAGVDGALALWGCASPAHIRADFYLSCPEDVFSSFMLEPDPLKEHKWLKWAMELQFIAQAGLTYSRDRFDRERFRRIQEIAAEIVSCNTPMDFEQVDGLFAGEMGYQTPKLDSRAAIIRDGKILLVQEMDGTWAMPGGWVDMDQTIKENTVKEAGEEAGMLVAPVRLVAVQDRNRHNKPPYAYNICKVFILCEPVEGEFEKNIETLGREWFTLEELPVLSEDKTTKEQIAMCFEAAADKDWKVLFD